MSSPDRTMQALREAGLRHPDVEEGVACKGTAIESVTLKVQGKAFLFLRPGRAMLKLGPSLEDAARLAADGASRCKVGSGGWVTVELSEPQSPPVEILERWVAESHGLFTAKKAPRKGAKSKGTKR